MCLMVFPSKDRAERAARFAKTKEVEAAKAAALLARQAEAEVRRESSARDRRYFLLYKCHPEIAMCLCWLVLLLFVCLFLLFILNKFSLGCSC